MFDLVEREENNCKYINRHTAVLTAIRAELRRNPVEIEYSILQLNESFPSRGSNSMEETNFDEPWLSRRKSGIEFSRKSIDSVFVRIKTDINLLNSVLWYRLNGGPPNTTRENLDIKVCTVDATDLTAVLKPDDAVFNCRCIQTFGTNADYPSSTVTHRNCLLVGMKAVEDNCVVNFEIIAKPSIKKDFRVQILDTKGKLVGLKRMQFLVQVLEH